MGGSSRTGPSKVQTFNVLSWTHEIFEVSKYKRNIKFGAPKWRYPLNRAAEIVTF